MMDQEDIEFLHAHLEEADLRTLNLTTIPTLRVYHPSGSHSDLPSSPDSFDALRVSLILATFNTDDLRELDARTTLKMF